MMKLSMMNDVVSTVGEEWQSPLADDLLKLWNHDDIRPKFWRASAHFIFFCKINGQDHVLRFNHADERAAAFIRAEIDLINTLVASNVRVARPVMSNAGNYVESVSTSMGVFHAVVFEALQGKQLDLEELSFEQIGRWGQALGELHNAMADCKTPGRPDWREQLKNASKILRHEDTVAHKALGRLTIDLDRLETNGQNYGLIHCDLEPDNIIWSNDAPGLIDFDDSAWNWYAADIAYATEDLIGSGNGKYRDEQLFSQFLKGYRSARSIEQAEIDRLPLFLRLQHMLDYARLSRALTPVNLKGELPWMPALREKLAAKMQVYRDEFVM